jgi:predicted nucleotidyltransferase
MPQYGWHNCPISVRQQTLALVAGLQATLGGELLGVYLHGSLAMGCYNPQRSDLDLLAVTHTRLPHAARPRLARLLLSLSGVPAAIEMSVLSHTGLHPWQHPAPYEFHYSEDWRDRTQAHLEHGTWPEEAAPPRDADLAAHITVTLARGLGLWGPPPAEVFPPVPAIDYADSILGDFRWGRDLLGVNPVYFVLNACRVRAYLEEGQVLSKDEGGEWGLRCLPPPQAGLVQQALRLYRGELASEVWNSAALLGFAEEMARAIGVHDSPQ